MHFTPLVQFHLTAPLCAQRLSQHAAQWLQPAIMRRGKRRIWKRITVQLLHIESDRHDKSGKKVGDGNPSRAKVLTTIQNPSRTQHRHTRPKP